MNKCVKIEIKVCKEIRDYKKILRDLRYQSWLASNKAMTYYYAFTMENIEYKQMNGKNIDERFRFGKTHGAWVQNRMNEVMTMHNSGNVAQAYQFVTSRFGDDKKKGLFNGQISISNFKLTIPIAIKNNNYKISQGNKGFEVKCSLFNTSYQKENDIKQVNFEINSLDNSKKSILNKIILGIYKQGSAQIIEDKKGKWYLIISFSFEPVVRQLDMNKVLGVDLGIVNTATMQVFDIDTQKWDRISWRECKINGSELIHYRQKIEARNKQMYIASKIVGKGRIGHGRKVRLKPVEKTRDKVGKFRDTYNHKISKNIIDVALKYNCGTVQMENLSGFSEQQSETFLKNWSYFDLQNKTKYKCEEKGIKFILIDPKYTSKRCSHCGCIDDENRDCKGNQAKFKCVTCGHEENADINAAKNISIPMIDSIIVEQLKMMSKFKDKKVS